jgi:hypothetical protein
MRARFVLAYKSRGKGKGFVKPTNPRVLLFNDDGSIIISFNGTENRAEIITPAVDNEFGTEFREVIFDEIKQKSQVNLNLRSCLNCHHAYKDDPASGRVNWGSYRIWDYFYGSHDDSFALSNQETSVKEEMENLKAFLAIAPSHKIYSRLVKLEERYPITFDDSRGNINPSKNPRPNLELNQLLHIRNARRIADQLKNTKSFESLRHFLLMMFMPECRKQVREIELHFKNDKKMNFGDFVNALSSIEPHASLMSSFPHNKVDYVRDGDEQSIPLIYALDQLVGSHFSHQGQIASNWPLNFDNNDRHSYSPFSTGNKIDSNFIQVFLFATDDILFQHYLSKPQSFYTQQFKKCSPEIVDLAKNEIQSSRAAPRQRAQAVVAACHARY